MTATTDQSALLAAIVADPDDDTVRLAYADFLDENPLPDAECPQCKRPADAKNWVTGHIFVGWGHGWQPCSKCDGTTRIPDDLHTRHAEFIRFQCKLAKMAPKPRELFVSDGAGKRLEGLGVALIPRGGGHYSASSLERGLSTETFSPSERVDIYTHLARGDRIGWLRGMKYVKHVEDRHEIIFRKDEQSKPWEGTASAARETALLPALRTRLMPPYPAVSGASIICSHCNAQQPAMWITDADNQLRLYDRPSGVNCGQCGKDVTTNRCPGTLVRGMPVLSVPLVTVGREAREPTIDLDGWQQVWKSTDWAQKAKARGAMFQPSDVKPAVATGEDRGFFWSRLRDRDTRPWRLPSVVFDAIDLPKSETTGFKYADTEPAAQSALSLALARLTPRAATTPED